VFDVNRNTIPLLDNLILLAIISELASSSEYVADLLVVVSIHAI